MRTAFITHADCLRHEMGAHHPERPERLGAIGDQLIASGVAKGGMTAKLQASRRALAAGVASVRISDVSALLDPAVGTRLTTAHSTA